MRPFAQGFLTGEPHLPIIQQSELAECGLACMAMIGRFHGHDIDLVSLRRRYPVSIKGATLARMIDIADKLDLQARPLRVELEYLPELRTPCVLHWKMNHFVVMKRATRTHIDIHDPASGVRRIPISQVGGCFTGVALEFKPAAVFKPLQERERLSIRTLIGRVTGLRRIAAQVLMLALALEIMTLAAPLAMQWVIDRVLVSADYSLLSLLGVGFLVLVAFQSATAAMRGWIVAGAGASLLAQWTSNLFGHMMRLPMGFFQKRSVGDVMSRFVSVQMIQQTLTGSLVEALLDGLTVGLVLVVLFVYSPPLTLLVLGMFTVYAIARWATFTRIHRLNDERMTYAARQHSQLLESLHGAVSIKLANKQAERHARVTNTLIEVAQREAAIQRIRFLFSAFARLVSGSQRILLIWIGAWMTIKGTFTAGMMVVFVAYADMFATRAGNLIDAWVDLRLLGLHADRVADIALEAPERNTNTGYVGPAVQPCIEVEGLSFRYAEDDPWVLRDCSFRIEAGESVAIVGPSGCGKTTLAKLLLGLLEPTHGTVRVGGIDIRRFGLDAYRAMFGTVMQDERLFAGSVAENIAFFDAEAEFSRVQTVARMAQIHDDIVAMPMGYETLVGDMGSALSGGQSQRILLARALYRDPPVLLLDEATSHLDILRERAINVAVAEFDKTRIFIAHRPDTIASAGRVLEMVNGSVRSTASTEYLRRQAVSAQSSAGAGDLIELGESVA